MRWRIRKAWRPGADSADVAAYWVAREQQAEPGHDAAAARDAWLAEDPSHVSSYDAALRAMARVDATAADLRMVALRQAALALGPSERPRWPIAAAVAAAVVLVSGYWVARGEGASSAMVAVVDQMVHPGGSVYRTDVGERSTMTLPDGSVATLNTDSVVRISYTDRIRTVRLVRGQALFEVAHDKARPFEVSAGDQVITALGTVFDVRLQEGIVKVALVEGRVKVRSGRAAASNGPGPQALLAPGEVLEARSSRSMQVHNADMSREISWRSGVVVFDETPLAEAVAELNRYSKEKLVVEDPAIAAVHVTGVYKTGDPIRFLRTLGEIVPIDIDRSGSSIVLSAKPQNISGGG